VNDARAAVRAIAWSVFWSMPASFSARRYSSLSRVPLVVGLSVLRVTATPAARRSWI